MVADSPGSRTWDDLRTHVRICGWCRSPLDANGYGVGLDGPPEGLCARGRVLERAFDLTRDVRMSWEWKA